MKTILLIAPAYVPGFKMGGPIRSAANLVDWLGDEFSFRVLTADRDLGDREPYTGVRTGIWERVGKAQVMYLPPSQMGFKTWGELLNDINGDILYLNSFFGFQTRHTLLLRQLGMIPKRPIVLTPRGEFSEGALSIKPLKKLLYMPMALQAGLYDEVIWHATSEVERRDILNVFGQYLDASKPQIVNAPNLPGKHAPHVSRPASVVKQTGVLRVAFLSRLARMKNLDFALASLEGLKGTLEFNIYGPIEDQTFWEECQKISHRLPPNIQVTYRGEMASDKVAQTLAMHHLFFLPTHGENFGHAIFEALAAGCPVLLSDQTPWRGLEAAGVGWDLPLSEPERFRTVLNRCIAMDASEFAGMSDRTANYAAAWIQKQEAEAIHAYRRLFLDKVNA